MCTGLAVMPPAGPRASASLGATEVVQGIQGWLDATRHLEARFSQALLSGALGSEVEESGRLYLERPGRLRWDYLEPERKVALVDGLQTRLYLEEDRQLWEGRLDESGAALPTLLAGQGRLGEMFEPTLVAGSLPGEATYRLRLVPRTGLENVEEVVLTVRAPLFAIEAAEVLDGAGNRILYRFSSLRRNRGLKKGIFQFEPPPGTEIVRQG